VTVNSVEAREYLLQHGLRAQQGPTLSRLPATARTESVQQEDQDSTLRRRTQRRVRRVPVLRVVLSGKSGPKDQVALHYYYTSPSHWCTTHEVSKLLLSSGLDLGIDQCWAVSVLVLQKSSFLQHCLLVYLSAI